MNTLCHFGPWTIDLVEGYLPQVDYDTLLSQFARNLSHICRFSGNLHTNWSVAQHSICVAALVDPRSARSGLLHDAHEAIVGDITTPVQRSVATLSLASFPGDCSPNKLDVLLRKWEQLVGAHYGVRHTATIKLADMAMSWLEWDRFGYGRPDHPDWRKGKLAAEALNALAVLREVDAWNNPLADFGAVEAAFIAAEKLTRIHNGDGGPEHPIANSSCRPLLTGRAASLILRRIRNEQ